MSDSRMLSDAERANIIKDIMAQNEVILAEHRKKLELEFQQQLKGMLGDLNSGNDEDEEAYSDSDEASPTKPVVDSSSANFANEQFFEAAQNNKSAPQIHIYEGSQHKATIRASQEATPMGEQSRPAVVSSSTSQVVNKDVANKKAAAPTSPTPANLQVYNQPLFRKSKSAVKREEAEKIKKLKAKQRDSEIEEKIRSQQMINRVESGGYGKSEEIDAMMYRVTGTTKTALMKSAALVGDISSHNKKIMKKYKKKSPDSGEGDDNGYAEFANHTSPKKSSKKDVTQPAKGKSTPVRKSGSMKQLHQHQSKKELFEERPTSSGFLPPVEGSTPREDAGLDSFGNTKEPMYVMQEDPSSILANSSADLTAQSDIDGVYQDKRTWENQLARHILSVYATSQVEDVKKSRAVLEFVDVKSKTTSDDLIHEGIFDKSTLTEQKQKVMHATLRKPKGGTTEMNGTATNDMEGGGPRGEKEVPNILKAAEKKKKKKISRKFREDNYDPVKNVGLTGALTHKTLDRKERDDINPLKATEENKVTRVGLVRAPPKCFPIWFVSSGDMYAEWLSLPDGDKLQSYLDSLMEKKKYRGYLETVENLLDTNWISAFYRTVGDPNAKKSSDRLDCGQKKKKERVQTPPRRRRMDLTEIVVEDDPPLSIEELKVLYRQLVLVSNAFSINCIERKDFNEAMLIIRMAERWSGREEVFEAEIRCELKAFINRTLAYYFYRTKKAGAALNHTNLSIAAFLKIGTEADNATSLLHLACCHFQVGKFKAAHETLYKVLGMVEDGRIAFSETEPKELCLVAIAYHNLAVVQLKMQVPDVAAKSSQNARKIARLCLSYSNRWINTFHWTHQLCLADVKYELENNFKLSEDQIAAMTELMKILYEPNP